VLGFTPTLGQSRVATQKIKRGNINNSNGRMHFDDMRQVMFLENPFVDFG
jgi:hypothetical protein